MVIEPISRAMVSTPAAISGLFAKEVYPAQVRVSNASGEQSHAPEDLFCPGSALLRLAFFLLTSCPTSPFLSSAAPCSQDIEYKQTQRHQIDQSGAPAELSRTGSCHPSSRWQRRSQRNIHRPRYGGSITYRPSHSARCAGSPRTSCSSTEADPRF